MSVLVIGGCGFFGETLVSYLIKKGKKVIIFDISPYTGAESCKVIKGNLTDYAQLAKAMEGIETVYHAAAVIDVFPKMTKKLYEVNVKGTENVVRCCQDQGVRKLIFTSSIDAIYDGKSYSGNMELDDFPYPTGHLDGYSQSKILGEKAVLKGRTVRLAVCILRPAINYGPKDTLVRLGMNKYGVKAPFKWPWLFPGETENKMSLVHVLNNAHCHYLAGEHLSVDSKLNGQKYMVSDDLEINAFSYLERIAKSRKGPKPLYYPTWRIPFWVVFLLGTIMEIIAILLDTLFWIRLNSILTQMTVNFMGKNVVFPYSKARRDFGYQPIVDFRTGFQETLKYKRKDQMVFFFFFLINIGVITLLAIIIMG
jgi:3beta-hydroxy-delta5-steroid dehydrogenase/steroid delta-isomerase